MLASDSALEATRPLQALPSGGSHHVGREFVVAAPLSVPRPRSALLSAEGNGQSTQRQPKASKAQVAQVRGALRIVGIYFLERSRDPLVLSSLADTCS